MQKDRNFKEYIYLLKGIAIICVVCAHTTQINENAESAVTMCSRVLDYIGTMGVPIFFMISGFLFARNKRVFSEFWERKIKSIFIPWMACAFLLWLYIVLRKGDMTIVSLIKFIIGYKHSTYYLTVLMVLYLLFWRVKKNWQLSLAVLVSVISIISTGWNVGICFINEWTGTYYLNVFNWMCFFCLGILLQRNKQMWCYVDRITDYKLPWLLCSILYFVLSIKFGYPVWYFSSYALVGHAINLLLAISVAKTIYGRKGSKVIHEWGKYSFSIYLLHQFVTGIIVALTNLCDNFVLILIRPIITIVIVIAGIRLLFRFNTILNGKLDFIKVVIGVR